MTVSANLFLDVTGPSEHDASIAEASTRRRVAVCALGSERCISTQSHGYFICYWAVTVAVSVCVCTMIVLRMCTYIRSLFCVLKGHVSTPLGPLRRPL